MHIFESPLQNTKAFKTQSSTAIIIEWQAQGTDGRRSSLNVLSVCPWPIYCYSQSVAHVSKKQQVKRDLHCVHSWPVEFREIIVFEKAVSWFRHFHKKILCVKKYLSKQFGKLWDQFKSCCCFKGWEGSVNNVWPTKIFFSNKESQYILYTFCHSLTSNTSAAYLLRIETWRYSQTVLLIVFLWLLFSSFSFLSCHTAHVVLSKAQNALIC